MGSAPAGGRRGQLLCRFVGDDGGVRFTMLVIVAALDAKTDGAGGDDDDASWSNLLLNLTSLDAAIRAATDAAVKVPGKVLPRPSPTDPRRQVPGLGLGEWCGE